MKTSVVEEVGGVMSKTNRQEYIEKLVGLNHLIAEDILDNPEFSLEELENIQCRMSDLIDQLEFWTKQGNQDRFCYELKDYINWMLENYS